MTISIPTPLGMNQPPNENTIIGPSAQYIEKHSQLPSSLFITVPSILPRQHTTLSPSGLLTDMPMSTPSKKPSRDPKNHHLKNFLVTNFFTKYKYQQETITEP